MTRKFLENKGLSKELIDEILDENSKDIGRAKGELETVKANLETAQKDNEGLKEQISKANTELDNLKKSTDDADAFRTQIENLQNQIKTDGEKHDAEIRQIKIDSAIDNALIAANANNAKAVKPLCYSFLPDIILSYLLRANLYPVYLFVSRKHNTHFLILQRTYTSD